MAQDKDKIATGEKAAAKPVTRGDLDSLLGPTPKTEEEKIAAQPTTTDERLMENPLGETIEKGTADVDRQLRNVTNVDVAPTPRFQKDEDVAFDPMKRQPGVAPLQVASQVVEPEEGEVDYVMVMPYWDGIQLFEKGTVLKFRPKDAPFGAKRVEAKKKA